MDRDHGGNPLAAEFGTVHHPLAISLTRWLPVVGWFLAFFTPAIAFIRECRAKLVVESIVPPENEDKSCLTSTTQGDSSPIITYKQVKWSFRMHILFVTLVCESLTISP